MHACRHHPTKDAHRPGWPLQLCHRMQFGANRPVVTDLTPRRLRGRRYEIRNLCGDATLCHRVDIRAHCYDSKQTRRLSRRNSTSTRTFLSTWRNVQVILATALYPCNETHRPPFPRKGHSAQNNCGVGYEGSDKNRRRTYQHTNTSPGENFDLFDIHA